MSAGTTSKETDNNSRWSLAIFTRAPVLHQTKTRLAEELGAEGALAAHRDLVENTLARLSQLEDIDVSLWVTQVNDDVKRWAKNFGLQVFLQQGQGLGERMHYALLTLLSKGAQRACLVGTDCPDIDAGYVRQAFAALEEFQVVLGPAEDGGYGLIGMCAANQTIFEGVSWGTPQVREQTLRQAKECDYQVAQLSKIWDVDTPTDWRRYLVWREAHPLD